MPVGMCHVQLGVRRPVPNEIPGWAYVESLAEMPGRGPLEANRLSELVANTIRIEACPDCAKLHVITRLNPGVPIMHMLQQCSTITAQAKCAESSITPSPICCKLCRAIPCRKRRLMPMQPLQRLPPPWQQHSRSIRRKLLQLPLLLGRERVTPIWSPRARACPLLW